MESILVKLIGGGLWAVALAALSIMLKAVVPPLLAYMTAHRSASIKRLEAREVRIDKALGDRLTHLEREVESYSQTMGQLRSVLGKYHKAVIILFREVRVIAPDNPKLAEIRDILSLAWPAGLGPMPPDLSDLSDALGNVP